MCRYDAFLPGLFVLLIALLVSPAPAHSAGRIEGSVVREDGRGVGGVIVVVGETGATAITDNKGIFALGGLPAGTYTVTFTLGDRQTAEAGVAVSDGETTEISKAVDWEISFAETITVFSASKRQERIVEAPAAITIVSEEQIEREASHGQLPKLLEFTPGAEVTQSGLYDYNFNTRGFNSSLNRRVATLIDGRDPSVPFLGAQEWAAISFPLDDLAGLELVRGPSAALYGANASSGVLNMSTKQPRYSQGGHVRLAGGELSTANLDLRYAGSLGNDWFFKLTAGLRSSGDFTRSRNAGTEYPGLPPEAVPLLVQDDNSIVFGGLRFDRYFDGGSLLTLEGGSASLEGPVFQTGIGRVQLVDVERPWARVNFNTEHWNVLAYYNKRDAPRQLALASGANLALDTNNVTIEVQTNWTLADGRVRLVGGGAYTEEEIDSLDPATGQQTLIFRPFDSDNEALFGQVDVQLSDRVKLVLAGRWDDSTLHDSQVSPKASVVYGINDAHSLRFTYNEAFQVANYSEFFLNAPAAPNADLSTFEVLCLVNGVADCGLAGPTLGGAGTRVLALGNDDLEVEEVRTVEVGYSGIIGGDTFLTIDYYRSDNENFITDLLPNVGTTLGRINPDFGAWMGSTAAESTPITNLDLNFDGTPDIPPVFLGLPVAVGVRALCDLSPTCGGLLSNNLDGENIIAARSYANFGEVDTQGVDFGINQAVGRHWGWALNYSWFDFDIKSNLPGFANLLVPNTPENKASASGTYRNAKLDASLAVRWSDEFLWSVGPFNGIVDSYVTADVNVNYAIDDRWTIGAAIANVTDDEHFESFGGDILERRALGFVRFDWE